jgi:antitoxin component YwqK of YwqJK toxin-antitoxin module|tara:strand:+ start:750 stop:1169 length:420 start_codon:yes stop_codon:yes gene_type:complete
MKNTFILFLAFCLLSCEENLIEKSIKLYPNGNVELKQFVNDKGEVKKEIHYFENGKTQIEGGYDKLGKRHGTWKSYYEDGVVWSYGEYKNGIQEGENKVYYSNGKIRYGGKWENDKQVGKWVFYDKKGDLIKSEDYSKN